MNTFETTIDHVDKETPGGRQVTDKLVTKLQTQNQYSHRITVMTTAPDHELDGLLLQSQCRHEPTFSTEFRTRKTFLLFQVKVTSIYFENKKSPV